MYEIDLEGVPPVNTFILMSEAFDHPTFGSNVNTIRRGGTPTKRLLHAHSWLIQDRRLISMLVDTSLACNLMLLGCCKILGAVLQPGRPNLIGFNGASNKFVGAVVMRTQVED